MKSLKLNNWLKFYVILITPTSRFLLEMQRNEYRSVIKFLHLNSNGGEEILRSLHDTYGDSAPSRSTVYYWIQQFKFGKEGVEDDAHTGRPATVVVEANVRLVEKLVLEDRRITVEELEGITGISDRSVRRILKDVLGFHKVSARWVPRMLTAQQKRLRKEISEDSIDTYSSDILKFLRRFVTMDEVWVYHYDPETKEQSKEWRKPEEGAPRKFRSVASTRKILACFLGH